MLWVEKPFLCKGINDLLGQLRIGNVFDINEVKYAIIKTNGVLSIMKYEDKNTPTLGDLGVITNSKELFKTVVLFIDIYKD
ncbi:MAG: DUF421 domain-containing protein [Epulopiscium sp.]|nr:DUF421 domain-containing protein [Candidatus Epulonipiscium sp.]